AAFGCEKFGKSPLGAPGECPGKSRAHRRLRAIDFVPRNKSDLMTPPQATPIPVLMIAYTNYATDGRVIREAEAAVDAGFAVDFLCLRTARDPAEEMIRGVRVIHLNQSRYRGKGLARYVLSYLQFFLRCFWKSTILFLRERYRVIHVNNMPDFLVFCTILPKLFGARIVLDIHDPMPNTFASKFRSGEKGWL